MALTAAELAEALGVNPALADRLHPVVVALVQRYAPAAPESIQREAAIRCAGWLSEASMGGQRSEEQDDIRTTYTPAATGPLRASGAMALLSAWKERRAGIIG